MSYLSEDVLALIKKTFPYYKVVSEHFVLYMGRKLFFDFFLPELLIAVEVQGVQHDVFVEHFHRDAAGFQDYKRRDMLKRNWALSNSITLVEVREADMPMTSQEFLFFVRSKNVC